MPASVTVLQPRSISYRGAVITLTHRPKINDWVYTIEYTRTITLSSFAPRYETALAQAKAELDAYMGVA